MTLPDLIHFAWLALAVLLEIAANIMLKYSNGFKSPCPASRRWAVCCWHSVRCRRP